MIKRHFFWWIVILIGLCDLWGCTQNLLVEVPEKDPVHTWEMHQKLLENMNSWTLKGQAGFSDGTRGGAFDFIWVQKGRDYTIHFDGPLGVTLGVLTKNKEGISLLTSSGKFFASTPEELMQEIFEFSLPMTGLKDWMIGLPQEKSSEKILNSLGYLMHLKEAGWDISYVKYGQTKGLRFPEKIILIQGQCRVVISIRHVNLR